MATGNLFLKKSRDSIHVLSRPVQLDLLFFLHLLYLRATQGIVLGGDVLLDKVADFDKVAKVVDLHLSISLYLQ